MSDNFGCTGFDIHDCLFTFTYHIVNLFIENIHTKIQYMFSFDVGYFNEFYLKLNFTNSGSTYTYCGHCVISLDCNNKCL